jgi:hypothetical protein
MLSVRVDVPPAPSVGSDPALTLLALGVLAVAVIAVTVLVIVIIRRCR